MAFQGPVLVLVPSLALIELLQPLLQRLGVDLQPRLVVGDIPELLVLLGEKALQVSDLGDKRGADLGGELNVVDAIGGLVPKLSVRDA